MPRVRDAGLHEPLALTELRRGRLRRRRVERMRDTEPGGDAGGDGDGEVDPRRDDAVDALRTGEAVDRRLVLDGHDRPPVGEAKAGRTRIAIDGDHVQAEVVRRLEQPELRGPRP